MLAMNLFKNPARVVLIVFVLTLLQGLVYTPIKLFGAGEDFIHPIVHFTIALIGILFFWLASRRAFFLYSVFAGVFFISLGTLGILGIHPHWMPLEIADNIFHFVYSTFVIG